MQKAFIIIVFCARVRAFSMSAALPVPPLPPPPLPLDGKKGVRRGRDARAPEAD